MINLKNFGIQFPNWHVNAIKAYAMINGELTSMEIVGTAVYLNEQRSIVICKAPNGNRIEIAISELYDDVEHYKRGESISVNDSNIASALIGHAEHDDEGEGFRKYYWVMAHGEPTKHYLDFESRVEFDTKQRQVGGVDIPADFYDDREDCIKWNDITSVEQDGTKTLHKSYHKALLLTDEQQAIVAEIADALKKAEQAGIKIGYCGYEDTWFAINTTDVDADFTFTDDIDEDDYSKVITRSETWRKFVLHIPAPYYVNDDNSCIAVK